MDFGHSDEATFVKGVVMTILNGSVLSVFKRSWHSKIYWYAVVVSSTDRHKYVVRLVSSIVPWYIRFKSVNGGRNFVQVSN